MIGLIVWLVLIAVMMTMIMPEIWIVFFVSGSVVLLLLWGFYAFKEKVILPYIEKIKLNKRSKRMAARGFTLSPYTNSEREEAIDAWEEKWGRTHPSRLNKKP